MIQTVLILGGNGKIGSHAASAFWNAGWRVRHYDRSTDMTKAALGVDVIVNGLNPPAYRNWAETIPAITAQVIAAAQTSGATVIIPGNLYNFGNHPGVLDETTPQTPHSRRGQICLEMEQAYRNAGVKTIILRAGNFIDPGHNDDVMSLFIMRDIARGKLTHGGDADALQAYCYLPDWGRAAVMLAEKRAALSSFEDVPFPGHAFTGRDLATHVQQATGQTIRLVGFPWWLMTALSPFWGLARELREMRYLYVMPHQISATKFERLLPDFQPTEPGQVMLAGLPGDIHPDKVMQPGSLTVATQ